eukprot:sb/3473434/
MRGYIIFFCLLLILFSFVFGSIGGGAFSRIPRKTAAETSSDNCFEDMFGGRKRFCYQFGKDSLLGLLGKLLLLGNTSFGSRIHTLRLSMSVLILVGLCYGFVTSPVTLFAKCHHLSQINLFKVVLKYGIIQLKKAYHVTLSRDLMSQLQAL